MQRHLLISADHQRHRGVAHPGAYRRTRRQRGGRLVGNDQQLILDGRGTGQSADTEIARKAHEARHLRLQAGDHQRRLTVLHVQRGRHSNVTDRHRHRAIQDVRPSVVEGHAHRGRAGAGEAIAQAEIGRARGLQRHLLITANHHRDRGLAHARSDQRARCQRGRCLVGHDEQFVLACGSTRRFLDTEIARQAHEARHLRLQAGDHQRRLAVLHIQRRRHRDIPHRHGHRPVHDVGPGVVEGHAHRGRAGTGKAIAQAQLGRARGLQRHLLITANHHRDRGLAHARSDQRAGRQRRRRLVGHDQQFVLGCRRTGRLLDTEIARQAHKARHLRLQAGDHQRRLTVLHVQRRRH